MDDRSKLIALKEAIDDLLSTISEIDKAVSYEATYYRKLGFYPEKFARADGANSAHWHIYDLLRDLRDNFFPKEK